VLFDVRRGKVHFRTSWNRAVKSFDYKNLDYSAATPVRVLNIDIRGGGEVGNLFKDYSHDFRPISSLRCPFPKASGRWAG